MTRNITFWYRLLMWLYTESLRCLKVKTRRGDEVCWSTLLILTLGRLLLFGLDSPDSWKLLPCKNFMLVRILLLIAAWSEADTIILTAASHKTNRQSAKHTPLSYPRQVLCWYSKISCAKKSYIRNYCDDLFSFLAAAQKRWGQSRTVWQNPKKSRKPEKMSKWRIF